jgi:hypothetical protein
MTRVSASKRKNRRVHSKRAHPFVQYLLIILAGLSLGSCGLFMASAFQPDLTLLEAQRDVSADIPPEQVEYYGLSTVDVGDTQYVILASQWSGSAVQLIVMDANLTVMQRLAMGDIGGTSLDSNKAMVDGGTPPRVLVGNKLFSASTTGLTYITTLTPSLPNPPFSNGPRWDFGFSIVDSANPSNNAQVTNFFVNGNTLSYCWWPPDWSVAGILTRSVAISSDSTSISELNGAYSDPSAKCATLVFFYESNKSETYVTIPWGDFLTTFSPSINLFLNYSNFNWSEMNRDLRGFAQGAFVGFVRSGSDSKIGDFIRFDTKGVVQTDKFHYENLPDILTAYPPSGGAYYTFNREDRTVSKLAAWWTQ